MIINIENAGKRYNNNWIFRKLSLNFVSGGKYAITGPNGSGKSTLLRIISGSLTLSEGTVTYSNGKSQVGNEEIFSHISISAPYLDIPEEYSLAELIAFHVKFKKTVIPAAEMIAHMELEPAGNRQLKYFSSGMKQKVKLGIAILTNSPVLLLDEPCTALDAGAIKWYQQMVERYAANKTVLVFSNKRSEEYSFCSNFVTPFE